MMADWQSDKLQHRTRIAFGADRGSDPGTWTWTDVTADVPSQSITINRGRSAEAGTVTPGNVSMSLMNLAGDYTPELATGAHYPNVVQGTPLQESLRGSTTFIELPGTGARISTPTSADLQVTGDFDVRVDMTLTQWRTTGRSMPLMSKAGTGTDQSWEIGITGAGQLYIVWRELVDSTVELWPDPLIVVPPSGRLAVRAAVDVDNGSGGLSAYFWTAATLDGPWEPLGDPVTLSGASALWPCSAPIEVGAVTHSMLASTVPPVGRLHGLEVRLDGTVRAKITAADVAEDATAFTGDDGRTWAVTAPAVATRWLPRITAAIAEWAPTWPHGDLSNPATGYQGDARVGISAYGVLQRLGQGKSPLQSTLRRRVPTEPTVVAYIPFEDGTAAAQAASGLPGGAPATFTGVTWASDATLPGSAPLPATGASAALSVPVPPPLVAGDGWHCEFVFRIDSAPASASQLINVQLASGTYREVQIAITGSVIGCLLIKPDGTTVDGGAFSAPNMVGSWNRGVVYARQNGTSVTIHYAVITIGGVAYSTDVDPFTGTTGTVTRLYANYGSAVTGLRIGHLGVFAAPGTTIYNAADTAFNGELAAERLIRLCSEENIPLLVIGDTARSTPMGPQGMRALTDLLQECADTDGGPLGEQRDRLGLRYRTLTSLYNQTPALTMDAAVNGISNPFAPTLSDQALRNQITAQRANGSSATAADKESIARSGLYDSQVDVNPAADTQLPDIAAWQVHLGTAPGMRYSQITTDLLTVPQLTGAWLAADTGDLAKVVNLPPQHPTDAVTALMQGYAETFSPTSWLATLNCTPGAPWVIGVTDDPVLGKAGSAGSELAADVDETATTIQVAVTVGLTWTTDPAQCPIDIRVGGEVMTVTAITGSTSPQAFTVVRSVNQVVKPQSAGEQVKLAIPMTVPR